MYNNNNNIWIIWLEPPTFSSASQYMYVYMEKFCLYRNIDTPKSPNPKIRKNGQRHPPTGKIHLRPCSQQQRFVNLKNRNLTTLLFYLARWPYLTRTCLFIQLFQKFDCDIVQSPQTCDINLSFFANQYIINFGRFLTSYIWSNIISTSLLDVYKSKMQQVQLNLIFNQFSSILNTKGISSYLNILQYTSRLFSQTRPVLYILLTVNENRQSFIKIL
eukprot:TRINITY_DN12267_c0_g1_i2.p1 TRINITY_DN12267_c0_g1~~TRINITY_DN12267_c0_g1_i2.p1  ORF type:complete len:217 (-),score=-8.18 TRINITY_DN12267_c0_g1_i2:146-796(-)